MTDDKVDLIPKYPDLGAKRVKGPDGKPLPREIVVPGQVLTEEDMKPGIGAYRDDGKILAATLGIKNVGGGFASVIPLGGRYIPRVGDIVIGRITDVGPSNWLIDINSSYPAPMHVNEVPWHVEFGETANFLQAGDAIIVRVIRVTEVKRIQVTMEGPGLRKLKGGQIVDISHSKVPRVIGTNGSMISLIKKYTGCRIVVGQNGRIWVDGEPDDILLVLGTIKMIEEQAHVYGLTNKVKEYLQKAKGIDPEVEAEEERKAAEAAKKERARPPKRSRDRRERPRKKRRRPSEEVDEDLSDDDIEEEELSRDPGAGEALVTVLSPDGESLMVLEDEDLPEHSPQPKRKARKEDD